MNNAPIKIPLEKQVQLKKKNTVDYIAQLEMPSQFYLAYMNLSQIEQKEI